MPPITTDDVDAQLLPREVGDAIFEVAEENSAIQQVAQTEPLSDSGRAIPILTGDPSAAWVGEGERKPVSDAGLSARLMDPKKLTTIVAYSTEVARRNPANLPGRLREKVGGAFGRAFDRAAITAAMGPFTAGLSDTTRPRVILGTNDPADGGLDADVVQAMRELAKGEPAFTRGYRSTGWVLHDTMEVDLLDARDTTGRPIYDPNGGRGDVPTLKGRPVQYGRGVRDGDGDPVGFGGDFEQAAWGQTGQIEYAVTEQATLEVEDGQGGTALLHLWQDNLAAFRAEAWYGFVIGDTDAFVEVRPVGWTEPT